MRIIPLLIDSNIIIYALNTSSPKQDVAQDFLRAHRGRLMLAHQNIFESLRILTHRQFPNPMTTAEAIKAVGNITDMCQVITPDTSTLQLALALVQAHDLSGTQVFDAYLAATALSAGVTTVATDNVKDFNCFEGISVLNPFKTV